MNPEWLTAAAARLGVPLELLAPLVLSLGMAWTDLRRRRIPNYLTFGAAITGLGFQIGSHGLSGLLDGFLGLAAGLALLWLPYMKGGMGAGDVKALAGLGAWLGLKRTLYLFIYMGLSGLLVIVVTLWWQGLLWSKLRQGWVWLLNFILSRPHAVEAQALPNPAHKGIPYGPALALGMAWLCWRPG